MKNNETGEFELVVGNRQLLSGFFIVVLLFAVAFAMGYVVGQNSPRSGKTADATSGGSPVMDRPQPTAAAAPAATPPAPPEQAAAPPPAGDNPPAQPDRDAAQPAQPSTQPAAPAEPPPGQAPTELQPGTCWQVMSVGQADADVVVRALKDKGFPAFTTPGPNNLTRILVGPYDNTQAMAHAKTELESAGFHPIRK